MRQGPGRFLDGTTLTSRVSRERSLIKSIQRGVLSIANTASTGTATITAVDVANSVLIISQDGDGTATGWPSSVAYVEFTNSTTLTATRSGTNDACRTSYEVIEYWPGVIKSVQRGTIALTGTTSNTATITSVDTTKATLIPLGYSCTDTQIANRITTRVTFTNATTITASRAVGTNNTVAGYQVVEFY